ncbi:hypothetical protein [Oryza sativa Japonica Group]|uniref:Uncharacterized protein n=1 Tax=Oryza sativa subsp. japonica TaxID=39947 RepID=Q5NBG5_ORYSJ|nr:hypothetical protein [Oryza sativa Japonica Group]
MPPISRKGTEEEASSPTQRTCTLRQLLGTGSEKKRWKREKREREKVKGGGGNREEVGGDSASTTADGADGGEGRSAGKLESIFWWPGYVEARPLCQRVSDIYLALNPAAHKACMLLERYRRIQARRRAAMERYRRMRVQRRVDVVQWRRKKRLVKRALIFVLPALETAMLGLTLLRNTLVLDSYTT